jgi:cyclic beta-1,2-glucan synthetase
VPENALLSHDLFEGLYARVALVSTSELVDGMCRPVCWPTRATASLDSSDEILMWLFPFVPSRHGLTANTLPIISRWKISTTSGGASSRRRAGALVGRLDGPAIRAGVWMLAALAVLACGCCR